MGVNEEWTSKEKFIARIISWGIIIAVVLIIAGGSWTAIEYFINPSGSGLLAWITGQAWEIQVLIIGGLIVGILVGIFVFSIFIRKGQRFILDLLFKIEE